MSNWYIGIRVEKSVINFGNLPNLEALIQNFGHVMVTITDPSGNTQVLGWMPDPGKSGSDIRTTVAGTIVIDQSSHEWDFEKRVETSETQVNALLNYIRSIQTIKNNEANLSPDEQTLRYYAAPSLAGYVAPNPPLEGKILFNCVSFAVQCLREAGVETLTNAISQFLSPGAIPRDDGDLRQKAAIAGVPVWLNEFVEAQAGSDTLIYSFDQNGVVNGTSVTDDIKGTEHSGSDMFVINGKQKAIGKEGNDYFFGGRLENEFDGGSGFDTYIVGGGKDKLRDDSKGEGKVVYKNGIVFTGGSKVNSNTWESGNIKYIRSGGLTIVVDGDYSNSTTIESFDFEKAKKESYLGIVLPDDEDKKPRRPGGGGGPGGGVSGGVTGGTGARPADPLVLDLDGDGVELTTNANTILFDHNQDGVRTGTQWVKADDGMLVRDLNGNGAIDSGRELFGDQTQISATPQNPSGLARNGFEALRALDSNADNRINASDAAFNELKVWRDLNQDGISQANELQSLGDAGISEIHLGQIETTGTGAAGDPSINTDRRGETTGQSSFVRNGSEQTLRNINFRQDTFVREFTDNPTVTAQAAALPQMLGSGLVRDMQEAMSLRDGNGNTTAAALSLSNKLRDFTQADNAVERQALIEDIIKLWGDTSSLRPAAVRRAVVIAQSGVPISGALFRDSPEAAIARFAASDQAAYNKMTVLEQFTGQELIDRYVRASSSSFWDGTKWVGYVSYVVDIESFRMPFFNSAYDTLKKDVYRDLYFETVGNDYLQDSFTEVTDGGLRVRFNGLDAKVAELAAFDKGAAALEIAEFLHFAADFAVDSGWDGPAQLGELLETASLSPEQSAAMQRIQLRFAAGDTSLSGTNGNDIQIGQEGNNALYGNGGNDVLIGGAGNDTLYGGAGDDQLVGGSGDDVLSGDWGNDSYFWGAGQGNDIITDIYANTNGRNTVVLRGLNPQDVQVRLPNGDSYTAIEIISISTGETLRVNNAGWRWYGSLSAPMDLLFADGTRWDMNEAVRQSLAMPTANDDVIIGTNLDDRADRLAGGAGDDVIVGRDGQDTIEGGAGNDLLLGNARRLLSYETASPTDRLEQAGFIAHRAYGDSDVYVFGRGDGQDQIQDSDYGANTDKLRFKAGIAAADLELAQRGNDLVLSIRGSTDRITVVGHFSANNYWWTDAQRPNAMEAFEFSDGTTWNLAQIDEASWAGTVENDNFTGDQRNNAMGGGQGDDVLSGKEGNDTLSGGAGKDTLSGDNGNDVLLGGEDADVLSGGAGDDVLDGGAGDDLLDAGAGADVIRFGRGDGQDTLAADINWNQFWQNYYRNQPFVATGNNVVELKAGVSAADVRLRIGSANSYFYDYSATDLTIQIVDAIGNVTDTLTIKNAINNVSATTSLDSTQFGLQQIRFADGTVWSTQEMIAQSLIGDAGKNTLYGFGSDDTLDGKGGTDTLNGGSGTNTYLFGLGDGEDTVLSSRNSAGLSVLQFKAGVQAQDVQVRRDGSAAVFTIVSTGESIRFDDAFEDAYYFDYSGSQAEGVQRLVSVAFADGTQWSVQDINTRAVQSTDGDDTIADVLSQGTTVLAGGLGNDTLISNYASTTYLFNRGDGQDTIIEESYGPNEVDTLRFGSDITASDLLVTVDGNEFLIGIRGTTDSVRLAGVSGYRIERFEVGGVTLTIDQIRSLASGQTIETLLGTSSNDILIGSDAVNVIRGFEGNDRLIGNGAADELAGDEGDDLLEGGQGNDALVGGADNDTLVGGTGRDALRGSAGSNTYRFTEGDALDTITLTTGETARIELGAGINASQIRLQTAAMYDSSSGSYPGVNRWVIGVGNNDAMVIEAAAGSALSASTAIELVLADGTILNAAQLLSLDDGGTFGYRFIYGDNSPLLGSDADDYIYISNNTSPVFASGKDNDDFLEVSAGGVGLLDGGVGDDTVVGSGSVLAGNKGDDRITGQGSTISYNVGDGRDLITGSGRTNNVLSFGQGMAADQLTFWFDRATGQLVIHFAGQPSDEIRIDWKIAGSSQDDPLPVSRLQFINAQGSFTTYDLEALVNSPAFDLGGISGNSPSAGAALLVQAQPMTGTRPVAGGLAAIAYAQTGNLLGTATITANQNLQGNNLLFGTPNNDVLFAGGGNDVVLADSGDDEVLGAAGDDYLDGQAGNDTLDGGEGDDLLFGGSGDDVLIGGLGNDRALGGLGSDTYRFGRGDGYLYVEDSFEESDGFSESGYGGDEGYGGYGGYGGSQTVQNTLAFGVGITVADLIFERRGNDLIITVAGGQGDEITLAGFDESRPTLTRSVDRFTFTNEQTLNLSDAVADGEIVISVTGQGETAGGNISEQILGGAGTDLINGNGGNDRLQGGFGSDMYVIDPDEGSDVIIDRAGEGNTILITGGIVPTDIRMSIVNGNVVIFSTDVNITLEGWNGLVVDDSPVDQILFDDGSSVSIHELFNRPRTIRGTPNDDVLTGTTGDDVIEGLQSNDLLLGDAGADTYLVDYNPGNDTITDLSSAGQANTLVFTQINNPSALRLSVNAEGDLVLIPDDGGSITLTNFNRLNALGAERTIEFFQFGSTVLTYEQLLERGFFIEGDATDDLLIGTNLQDEVRGGAGDDFIDAGRGSDLLIGGAGNDTYNYSMGDGIVTINDFADGSGGNVLRFGANITPEMLNRKLRFEIMDEADPTSNRLLIVFDQNNQISISGFDRNDPEQSAHGIDAFEFADGTVWTWSELLDQVFVVEGNSSDDALLGTSRSDRLYGYDGADELQAGAGNDVVTGGFGNDQLNGGAGGDNYVFAIGHGNDVITDGADVPNTITFEAGVSAGDVRISRNDAAQVVISYGDLGDSITLATIDGANPASVVDYLEFSDGTNVRLADLLNQRPVSNLDLADQQGRVGDALSFALPANAFADPDGDALRLIAQLANGAALPVWLTFDPATGLFSGTPPAGMQGTYEVTVYAADTSGAAMSQNFSLVIVPRNTAPEAMSDSAAVAEDLEVLVSGNVLTNDLDQDADALNVTNPGQYNGLYGQLNLLADGSYSYVLDNSSPTIQALAAGQQLTESFDYAMTDGQENRNAVLTLTITGTNDAPVAVADTAITSEDASIAISGNVLTNDSDLDTGALLVLSNHGEYVGAYGTLTLNADGSYSYALNNSSNAVQSLAQGQQVQDSFAIQTSDGIATVGSSLVITVTGTNDAPQVQADVASAQEDGLTTATGNVLTNDSDPDAANTLSVSNTGSYAGQYGQLSLNTDGSYTYQLNNGSASVQSLASGQQVQEIFAVLTSDGVAQSASQLTITVQGTNDGPAVQADVAAVTEELFVTATGNVLTNDSDVDAGAILSVANAGSYAGTYGSLAVQANGNYVYTLNNSANAVQSLRAGTQVQDIFSVTTTDGTANALANLTITVTGTNDAPVARGDVASVIEDPSVLTASGNVLTNDSDVDVGTVLQVVSPGNYAGTYGSLALQANGSYVYTLSNSTTAVQSLGAGQQVSDTFTYSASDGAANSSSQLVITITGSNDAPTLNTAIADVSAQAGQVLTVDLPNDTFKDIDQGDLLGYSATLSNGTALPSWLSFNANGLIFSGTPPQSLAGQSLEVRVTALDRLGASASDVFTLTVTGGDICTGLTLIGTQGNDRLVGSACSDTLDGRKGFDTMIGGAGDDVFYVDQYCLPVGNGKGNEGLGNGEDPPPPGHDDNYNDGPGTSPGNPGNGNGNGNGNGTNSTQSGCNTCTSDDVIEYLNQGYDRVIATVDYVLPQHVEALTLGGTSSIDGTGNSLDNWLSGNSTSNSLDGKDGNDLISAGAGDDCLYGGTGNDILEGQDGNDSLEGGDGRDALFGGAGNDTLKSNAGRGFLAGGRGNDKIYVGTEATTVAFNKGDGCDSLYLNGSSPITLSLGGGLKYEDIKVRRSGNDLYLDFDSNRTDSIHFVGYYGLSTSNRPALTMQMLTQASGVYNEASSDVMRNDKTEQFNLSRLIQSFDTAYATSSSLRRGNPWAAMNSLLDAHLGGSDTAALGGDLAYQFGSASSSQLAGMSMGAAGAVLAHASFATGLQTLQPSNPVSAGPRLMG